MTAKRRCRCKAPSAPHPRGPCDHPYRDHPGVRADEGRLLPGERVLTEEMGGEVATTLRALRGVEFECLGAARPGLGLAWDHVVKVSEMLGYPHEGGVPDGSGKTWWMYVRCACGYEMAAWKIARRVRERPLPALGP